MLILIMGMCAYFHYEYIYVLIIRLSVCSNQYVHTCYLSIYDIVYPIFHLLIWEVKVFDCSNFVLSLN